MNVHSDAENIALFGTDPDLWFVWLLVVIGLLAVWAIVKATEGYRRGLFTFHFQAPDHPRVLWPDGQPDQDLYSTYKDPITEAHADRHRRRQLDATLNVTPFNGRRVS